MKPHRLCSRIWGLKLQTRHFSSSSTWGHWLSTLCSILLSPDLQLCESPSLHPSQQGADVYRICGFSCEPDLHLLLSHHFEEFEIPRWEGVDTRFHLGFSSIILHVQTIRLNCISGVDSILPQTLTGYLFLGAAAYIMTVWALQKHKRLRKVLSGLIASFPFFALDSPFMILLLNIEGTCPSNKNPWLRSCDLSTSVSK